MQKNAAADADDEEADERASSESEGPMQQVTRVRQQFPESWIWTDVVVNK